MPDTPAPPEKAIFLAALDLKDAAERERYLDAACGGDAALRQRVEKLLASCAAEEEFPAVPDITSVSVEDIPRTRDVFAPAEGDAVGYFGEYLLLNEIARGGSGIVFRARQTSLNRTVALKMLRVQPGVDDPVARRRFQVEAEAAATLDHPGIVPIYEVGVHEERDYFSMKLVEGGTLGTRMAEYQADHRRAVALMVKVCRAVHHGHQQAILHRDLKPGNILIDTEGEPHVTDFGLARHLDLDLDLTVTGMVLGTPHYMSPEQARGESRRLTVATDVYSLGTIQYELVAGRRPFTGDTMHALLQQVATEPPPSLRSLRPEVDRDLDTIVMRCLEKAPAARYGSAEAFADDLEHWLRGEPIAARRPGAVERVWKWAKRKPGLAAAAGLAALLAVALVVALAVSRHLVGKALQQSEESLALSKQLLDRAEGRVSYMTTVLPDLLEPLGRLDLLHGPFQNVEEYYRTMPPVARDAAALSRHAGFLGRWSGVLWKVGDRRARLDRLEQAAGLVENALKRQERGKEVWITGASVFRWLADAREAFNNPAGAAVAAKFAKELAQEGRSLFPDEPMFEQELAMVELIAIRRLIADGKGAEAAAFAASQAPVWRELFAKALDPAYPGARACREAAGEFFRNWAGAASPDMEKAIGIVLEYERLMGEAVNALPDDAGALSEHGSALSYVSGFYGGAGDRARTAEYAMRFRKVAQEALSRDPTSLELQMEVHGSALSVARVARDNGDIAEEARLLESAAAGLESIQARDGALDNFVDQVMVSTMFMLARNLKDREQYDQAMERISQGVDAQIRATAGRASEWAAHQQLEHILKVAEGRHEAMPGALEKSIPLMQRTLTALSGMKGAEGTGAMWTWNRGCLLRRLSHRLLRQTPGMEGVEKAWPLMQQAMELLTGVLAESGAHPGMVEAPATALLKWMEAAPEGEKTRVLPAARKLLEQIPDATRLDAAGKWREEWARAFEQCAALATGEDAAGFTRAAGQLKTPPPAPEKR